MSDTPFHDEARREPRVGAIYVHFVIAEHVEVHLLGRSVTGDACVISVGPVELFVDLDGAAAIGAAIVEQVEAVRRDIAAADAEADE
jgi:hypothetical protein